MDDVDVDVDRRYTRFSGLLDVDMMLKVSTIAMMKVSEMEKEIHELRF